MRIDGIPRDVITTRLGVGIASAAYRVEHVALGHDARAFAIGVVNNSRTYAPGRHQLGRLAQCVLGADHQHRLAHGLADYLDTFHGKNHTPSERNPIETHRKDIVARFWATHKTCYGMGSVLRVAEFYAANRGGGLYSEAVSQRLGAVIALAGARGGVKPTVVTLASLVVGVTSSIVLTTFGRDVNPWVALLVLLGWQLAYALDCADGQLARVTKQAGPAGARVDVLCDVAGHAALVTALVTVADPPLWLGALFAGTWMVNIIMSVLAGGEAPSLIATRSRPVRFVKLFRDYGALVLAAGLIVLFVPSWLVWYLVCLAAINSAFLLASIVQAARLALR
jgi:phosphatidylglycerophosphate synthase